MATPVMFIIRIPKELGNSSASLDSPSTLPPPSASSAASSNELKRQSTFTSHAVVEEEEQVEEKEESERSAGAQSKRNGSTRNQQQSNNASSLADKPPSSSSSSSSSPASSTTTSTATSSGARASTVSSNNDNRLSMNESRFAVKEIPEKVLLEEEKSKKGNESSSTSKVSKAMDVEEEEEEEGKASRPTQAGTSQESTANKNDDSTTASAAADVDTDAAAAASREKGQKTALANSSEKPNASEPLETADTATLATTSPGPFSKDKRMSKKSASSSSNSNSKKPPSSSHVELLKTKLQWLGLNSRATWLSDDMSKSWTVMFSCIVDGERVLRELMQIGVGSEIGSVDVLPLGVSKSTQPALILPPEGSDTDSTRKDGNLAEDGSGPNNKENAAGLPGASLRNRNLDARQASTLGMSTEEQQQQQQQNGSKEEPNNKNKRAKLLKIQETIRSRLMVDQVAAAMQAAAEFTFDYLCLAITASILAGVGLATNNAVIIVASMLVSPIMGPILSVTFGTVIRDKNLIKIGLISEGIGLAICLIVGFLIGTSWANWGDEFGWPNPEMANRGTWIGMYSGIAIALASGFGVALSVLGNNTSSLVGVAISASLLPPSVNAGMLFAYAIWAPVMHDSDPVNSVGVTFTREDLARTGGISLLLTIVNIICVYATALIMFKIKEVAPIPGKSEFWREAIPNYREYGQTVRGREAAEINEMLQQELENSLTGAPKTSSSSSTYSDHAGDHGAQHKNRNQLTYFSPNFAANMALLNERTVGDIMSIAHPLYHPGQDSHFPFFGHHHKARHRHGQNVAGKERMEAESPAGLALQQLFTPVSGSGLPNEENNPSQVSVTITPAGENDTEDLLNSTSSGSKSVRFAATTDDTTV